MSNTMMILVLLGGICGIIGLCVSLICLACVVGFLRSTHKIQYVPLQDDGENAAKEVAKTSTDESFDEELKKVGRIKRDRITAEIDQEISEITHTDFLT